jgi:hypothetical protein
VVYLKGMFDTKKNDTDTAEGQRRQDTKDARRDDILKKEAIS